MPLLLVLRALVRGRGRGMRISDFKASLINIPSSKLSQAAWKDPVSKTMTKLHIHTYIHIHTQTYAHTRVCVAKKSAFYITITMIKSQVKLIKAKNMLFSAYCIFHVFDLLNFYSTYTYFCERYILLLPFCT